MEQSTEILNRYRYGIDWLKYKKGGELTYMDVEDEINTVSETNDE